MARICLATSLDRYLGFSSSPLFTSTHLTEMGRRPERFLATSFVTLAQDPFAVEVRQLLSPSAPHQVVTEDLSCEVVSVAAAVALCWAVELALYLCVVIGDLYAEAATLREVVPLELHVDPLQDSSAQSPGIACSVDSVSA